MASCLRRWYSRLWYELNCIVFATSFFLQCKNALVRFAPCDDVCCDPHAATYVNDCLLLTITLSPIPFGVTLNKIIIIDSGANLSDHRPVMAPFNFSNHLLSAQQRKPSRRRLLLNDFPVNGIRHTYLGIIKWVVFSYGDLSLNSFISLICDDYLCTSELPFGLKCGLGCSGAIFALRTILEHFTNNDSSVAMALEIRSAASCLTCCYKWLYHRLQNLF